MKHLFILGLFAISLNLFSQNQETIFYSPNGILDTVFYESGSTTLEDIRIGKVNIDPITGQVKSTNIFNCNSGYFELYIEDGSGFEDLPATNPMASVHQQRRALLCQVFSDISNFITSPLSSTGGKVRIWIRDINSQTVTSTSQFLGMATAFYVFPQNGSQVGYGGLADNEIWKTIHLGSDSYQNIIPSLTLGGSTSLFYHGMVTMNFDPSINWNTDLSLTTIPSNQHDLYTVLLHEITHSLGFSSRIDFDGTSQFGPNHNYFTRFDSHLKNNNLSQNLISSNSACGLYNFVWNNALATSILHPGCSQNPPVNSGNMLDVTNCNQALKYSSSSLNIPVYTPMCYEDGSSLSHFEDMCFPTSNPLNNNAYFCMANSGSSGTVKRKFTSQERQVLCDIGYTVGNNFGVAPNNANYGISICSGINVAGKCDGISGTTFSFVGSATTASPIIITGLLANDYNATNFTCLEDITDPSAFISNTSGSNATQAQLTSTINGLHILRYIPINAAGQQGNITYVYAFVSGGCMPDMCNLINNGGFENSNSCASFNYGASIDCWNSFIGYSIYLYRRNCSTSSTSISTAFNIPNQGSIDTWDSPQLGNDVFTRVSCTENNYLVSLQSLLNTPLIPGNNYQIRLHARKINIAGSTNNNNPLQLTIGATNGIQAPINLPCATLPTSVNILQQFLVPSDFSWHLFQGTFVAPQALNNLTIFNTTNMFYSSLENSHILIDDIELIDLTLSPPLNLPAVVCINQTPIFDPGNAPVGGAFSGPGTAANGSFNPVVAGVGIHEIAYTFTNNNGCQQTIFDQVEVVNSTISVTASASNATVCSGQNVTLSAQSSGATNFVWNPGLVSGATISTTVNASTNFQVTAMNVEGCVATADVPVITIQSSATIAGPSAICQGQTATLTATGGTSYSWSPGGQTTASITVSPTSTTTYTVTATNANGCTATATKTLTVNPTPTPTIAGPSAICQGQTATLTATGGTSYSWSPGGQTTASILVSPSATSMYTVTATDANGCVGTATKTVTVNAIPTVTVSPTNATICSLQSTILIATGGTTYSWSSGGQTSASISVAPISTTTYSVTGTTNGCTATASSTITVQPCTDCVVPANTPVVPATITSNANYNGTTVVIPNNVTISANVTFTNCNVKIMPGVTITLSPTATLNINGSHLYGCESMWQGIVVQAGGKVSIQQYVSGLVTKTTLIEDATIAIDYAPITVSQATPVLQVNNAMFNRNATAINIQGYPFGNVATIFSVKNSLFTCRNIYNVAAGTWAPTSTVKTANNNTNLFLEPYITATYPVANLKFPMAATFSEKGINLLNVGTTTNTSPPVYTSIVFGSTTQSEFNLFDNLKVGIYAENSNFKVINTTFQFPQVITNAMYSSTSLPNIGTGIFAKNTTGSRYKVDVAGTAALPNSFYGLSRAVDVLKYNNVQFVYNTIRSNRPSFSVIGGNNNGRHGVYMTMSKYDNVFIDHNTIYNIEKGVYLNALNQGNSPTVRVTYNTIQKDLSTTIGAKMKDAILLENALSTGSNTGGTVWVNNNTISGVYRAITLKTWKRTNIQVNNNGIALVGNNLEFPQCHGINLEQCAAGSLQSQIYNNSITGFNLNYIGSKGINITASTGNELKCNAVNNTYSGLYFNGNCNPTKTFNNSMQNHRYGFTLDNNGIIGQQGTATTPADNRWLGTTWSATGTVGGNFKNACLNGSNTDFSKMYVRSGSIYNPNLSTTNIPGNQWYQIASPQTLFTVLNPPLYVACSAVATPPANALIVTETTEALVSSTTLANSSSTSTEQKAVIQNQTYRQLDADTTLLITSASLTTYYDSLSTSNTAKQLSIEKAIANDSISMATSLNSAVQTANILEESYKQVYAAMLNVQNGTFNTIDSVEIVAIAAGCPTLQGGSVALANALYNAVYHEAEVFTPVCPEYLDKNMQQASFDESEKSEFVIYPVPNNGSFDIIGELKKDMHLTIMNMDGKIVHLQKITEETSILSIRTNLSNGTYTVLLTDENEAQLARIKIVVIK